MKKNFKGSVSSKAIKIFHSKSSNIKQSFFNLSDCELLNTLEKNINSFYRTFWPNLEATYISFSSTWAFAKLFIAEMSSWVWLVSTKIFHVILWFSDSISDLGCKDRMNHCWFWNISEVHLEHLKDFLFRLGSLLDFDFPIYVGWVEILLVVMMLMLGFLRLYLNLRCWLGFRHGLWKISDWFWLGSQSVSLKWNPAWYSISSPATFPSIWFL